MANGEEAPKAETPKSKSRLIIWLCVLVAFIAIFGVFAKTMFFRKNLIQLQELVK